MKERLKEFSKYFLIGIVLLLLFLSYKIIQPYIIVLISAFVISFLTFPGYKKLSKYVGNTFSALICVFLLTAIIILPIGTITTQITSQAYSSINNGEFNGLLENLSSNQFFEKISSNPFFQKLDVDPSKIIKTAAVSLLSLIASAAKYLPSFIISFAILLFSIFFMLVRWEEFSKQIKEFIPFKNKENIIREIGHSTHEILYGYLFIALILFLTSALCFYLSGVSLYLFFACIVGLLAFIPGLGSAAVILPMIIYSIFIGDISSVIKLAITGVILVVGIEILLSNRILSSRAKINPLIMLIGILGGTMIFGLFGFIIGPLVLVYTIKIVKELLKN